MFWLNVLGLGIWFLPAVSWVLCNSWSEEKLFFFKWCKWVNKVRNKTLHHITLKTDLSRRQGNIHGRVVWVLLQSWWNNVWWILLSALHRRTEKRVKDSKWYKMSVWWHVRETCIYVWAREKTSLSMFCVLRGMISCIFASTKTCISFLYLCVCISA